MKQEIKRMSRKSKYLRMYSLRKLVCFYTDILTRRFFCISQTVLVDELVIGIGQQNELVREQSIKVYGIMYGVLVLFAAVLYLYASRGSLVQLHTSLMSLTILPLSAVTRVGKIRDFIVDEVFK